MSNLGMYQKMTTASKKVGGPQNFLAITALCGYCTFRFGEHLIKAGLKKLKTHNQYKTVYTVSTSGKSNEGLQFNVGDTFRILEQDGDAVLIEKDGEPNNPYFVSAKLLHAISNY